MPPDVVLVFHVITCAELLSMVNANDPVFENAQITTTFSTDFYFILFTLIV